MCLALPACVEQLLGDEGAIVNLGGVKKKISLALLEDVAEGDYVIVHAGYALQKLDQEEAAHTLAMFAEMSTVNDLHGDEA
jgi:hydrogenase expression/formation protein HypC